ncbi:HU family DNA-binding protein [Colwellia sp. BRX8-6]|nr:HU family DNA-binding protein [Colwellia sp. BRX8-3]MBA6361176.1 HU family DNA-binding protein [Colwellia sp. BRX8-6]MBA6368410.1 HU family DNA-binding protein [Colwellia sp. BRX8-5]MBA6375871.1 HU family DNA-binding protein [Colwellia sp. BRX8-2]
MIIGSQSSTCGKIQIATEKVPKFKASKALKDAVNV